ncbi:MAG: Rieske (2Fe-2S) protein [Opitutaceae bacterium]|nr:Rieske (2Fe-2S) protein [Cephaloticoccus sp.]MCP5530404.1 Rieske (2Fe-2S) protein [Opitutaceae bacterium]
MTSKEHDAGPVTDFQNGKPHRILINDRPVLIVRKGDEFFAMRDGCPHAGASLAKGQVIGIACQALPGLAPGYEREGEVVTCPWHGWSFDLRTGCSLVQPQRYRVRAYQVEVRDGRVWVQTG